MTVPIKGENYLKWARSMKTALRAKTKLGFIDGIIKKPYATYSEFHCWDSHLICAVKHNHVISTRKR